MSSIIRLAQYNHDKGLTALQAVQSANKRKLRLLSNKEFDKRLVKTDIWEGEKEIYPAWTGTLVAYKKDKKLSSTLEYTDSKTNQKYIFDVPKEVQNQKNICLAINHGFDEKGNPIFELKEEGKNTLVQINDSSKIKIIENFPTENGWYLQEDQFGIPQGSKASSDNEESRYLYKTAEYVGLLARDYYDFIYYYRHYVYADVLPSFRFGVLGEQTGASESDAKISAPSKKDFENAMQQLQNMGVGETQLSIIQAYADAKQ